jgi:hypothetical protein
VLPFTNAALMCGQASAGGPPPWSGAPGYIGSGAFTEVAGDQSHDVPYPSGIMVEDILILHVEWYERTSVTPTVNAPAGWTQISQGQSFTLHTQAIFYKRADGTETGTALSMTPKLESSASIAAACPPGRPTKAWPRRLDRIPHPRVRP